MVGRARAKVVRLDHRVAYQHIVSVFTKEAVDWDLIARHPTDAGGPFGGALPVVDERNLARAGTRRTGDPTLLCSMARQSLLARALTMYP